MSNGVNFKDLCIDLRGKLDRVTAERDAALEEISILKHPMNSAVQARAERDAYKARELQSRTDLAKRLADHFRKNAEISALQQRLTAADERFDLAATLLRETAAVLRGGDCYGWEDNQADAIDKFLVEDALKPAEGGECDHLYIHFGTEQPRRRCNKCNKLEPVEGGVDEA